MFGFLILPLLGAGIALRTLTMEELDIDLVDGELYPPYGMDDPPNKVMLERIKQVGFEMVPFATTSDLRSVDGKVKPRNRFRFPWRTKQMKLWRLEQLVHPLWLGQDGEIYRAYDATGWSPSWMEPGEEAYWLRAELELRDLHGLQRVLNALDALDPSRT